MSEHDKTTNSLAHTKWNCKYHIVFAPKYRRKVFYEKKRNDSRYPSDIVCLERCGDHRRRGLSGSHPLAAEHSAQN